MYDLRLLCELLFMDTLMKRKISIPESMLTGHKQIDQDHQSIIDHINEIFGAIEHEDMKTIKKLVDQILPKFLSHHSNEEAILLELDLPNYENHKISHTKQIENMNLYVEAAMQTINIEQFMVAIDNFVRILFDDIIRHDGEIKTYLEVLRKQNI